MRGASDSATNQLIERAQAIVRKVAEPLDLDLTLARRLIVRSSTALVAGFALGASVIVILLWWFLLAPQPLSQVIRLPEARPPLIGLTLPSILMVLVLGAAIGAGRPIWKIWWSWC
jgi:hypothetical protein